MTSAAALSYNDTVGIGDFRLEGQSPRPATDERTVPQRG